MIIEILYPEVCNLYSDISNMNYLKNCLKEAKFIETSLDDEPYFINNDVNLIYLGSMTEKMQEKLIKILKPYKDRIEYLINNNTNFLFTGNSFEILGKYILEDNGNKITGLDILPIYTERKMMKRYNEVVLGKFLDLEIIGYKYMFTESYGDNTNNYFIEVSKGTGINKKSKLEGIKINNFIGTSLVGPLLIINPLFTKYLLEKLGGRNPQLYFENDVLRAYQKRLSDIKCS